MKKVQVDVKEIWDHTITVEVPDDATRQEIIAAAEEIMETSGDGETEYNRTMDSDMWTVRDGDHYYGPVNTD